MAQLSVGAGLPVRFEELFQGVDGIQMFGREDISNLFAEGSVGCGIEIGVVAGCVDCGQHREQSLAAVQLVLRGTRRGLSEGDGGNCGE